MKGLEDVKEQQKGPFARRKRFNKLATFHDAKWTADMPGGFAKLGTAEVRGEKNKITIDLTKVVTVDLIACDAAGNQGTYRLWGVKID